MSERDDSAVPDSSGDKKEDKWHLLDHWKDRNFKQEILEHKFDPFIRIYCEGEPKPTWRGLLHYIPLFVFSASLYPLLTKCTNSYQTWVVLAFCGVNIYAFMCSIILHTWHLNPVQEIFIQKCDHAGVFLNTAMHTTQYLLLGLDHHYQKYLLALTWMTCAWGIVLIILKKKRNYHTAFCPMGLVASLPVLHSHFTTDQLSYFLLTWLALSLGLLVFVTKRPFGWPQTFGYHEYFHLLTVVATFTSIRLEYSLLESLTSRN
jgi:hemolysin III